MAGDPAEHKRKPSFAEIIIAIACGLSLATTAITLAILPFGHRFAGARDFVFFWATGQQLIHHGNPWDAVQMGQIERSAGFTGTGSYYMRNPPWALPLALPFGFADARVMALPWSLLMAGLLFLSARLLWRILGRPPTPKDWLAYGFPPALICVSMGQTTLLPLLGMVLFLLLHRNRPVLAGAALWFCSLKPHLFVPWALVLLLWIVVSRRYRILLGAIAIIALSCGVTLLIDPHAFAQYAAWMGHSGISNEFIPCLSVALRAMLHAPAPWLTYVPLAAGCVWALFYFWPRRHAWDWMEHGGLLILVSLLVAPYCWIYDQALALPALLYAAGRTSSQGLLGALGLMYLLIEIQIFAASGLGSAWYLWTAPAWLVWYLLARARREEAAPASAVSANLCR